MLTALSVCDITLLYMNVLSLTDSEQHGVLHLACVCVCESGLQLSTFACEYVHLAPLYLHTAISWFIYHARAAAGVWSPRTCLHANVHSSDGLRGQWQALKEIRTYSSAVIMLSLRARSRAEVEMFSRTSSSPLLHTGQERQQSAPVILVMISLRQAIASPALFNKGTFEVLCSNPRLSFYVLPVHCKWNQNEGKEIKRRHLFSWALHSL